MHALILFIAIAGIVWLVKRHRTISYYDNTTTQQLREQRLFITRTIENAQREHATAQEHGDTIAANQWKQILTASQKDLSAIDATLYSRGVAH